MPPENPLLVALPPATDYLSYLTVIEHNLTKDLLPTLHLVLQDTTLTENIGWDLVQLLLPLLSESEQCLHDVARLGNPREVILKVTESLHSTDEAVDDDSSADDADSKETDGTSRFTNLVSMLSILHTRIRTKYPSRFLAGSLQATLAAFSRSASHREELVAASLRLVKSLANTHRGQAPPQLPPRAVSYSGTQQARAPDPEAESDTNTGSSVEADTQRRLLQSFLTHILETYATALNSDRDVPGLAWSGRLHERLYPERSVRGKKSMAQSFETDSSLQIREHAVAKIVELAAALRIENDDLIQTVSVRDSISSPSRERSESDEPPKSAEDIPLSRYGSLLLLAARVFEAKPDKPQTQIWPNSAAILQALASEAGVVDAGIGSEPEAVLDAILTLALDAVASNNLGQPRHASDFNLYLQTMSIIASSCPSPSLRYQAYYLTTTILRSNPSDVERLAFIHDTLEHSPFDNLKVVAVSWIKGEILEANPAVTPEPSPGSTVFSTPIALDTLGPFLFPDLTRELASPDVVDRWEAFERQAPFYLATLNFYFLLLSARHLWKSLALPTFHFNNDIAGSFLQPLRDALAKFQSESEPTGGLAALWKDQDSRDEKMGQLKLMQYTLTKVTQAVIAMNNAG